MCVTTNATSWDATVKPAQQVTLQVWLNSQGPKTERKKPMVALGINCSSAILNVKEGFWRVIT